MASKTLARIERGMFVPTETPDRQFSNFCTYSKSTGIKANRGTGKSKYYLMFSMNETNSLLFFCTMFRLPRFTLKDENSTTLS